VVNKDIEKQVLIGLITSDKINHSLKLLLEPKLFQLNVGQTVSKWIKEYYALYNRAPKKDIQEIYLSEKTNLNEEDSQDISEFLQSLSQQYLDNPPNEDYLLNQANLYLKKQSLLAGIKEADFLLTNSNGDLSALSAAEAALAKYKKATVETLQALNPFDSKNIISSIEEDESPLLVLRGVLGKFVGPIHRGYLIGLMGRMKIGKTFYVQQIVTDTVENRLRTVFVSLEMPWKKMVKRYWQQIGCFGKVDGIYEFPIFDCQRNQANKCDKSERKCHVKKGEEGYEACYSCREGKDGLVLITDLIKVERPGITSKKVLKVAKNFALHYGKHNLRFLSYPAFSANLSQIMNDIDSLEWREGFIPDVIVIDYPGILAEEKNQGLNKEYVTIGETWKTLKRIAEERQVAMFCPIQTDRSGTEATHLRMKNTAGYIQIIAHLDKCITLNQTESDYDKRIVRIGKIADRWDDANLSREIKALTQLQCGQPLIDGIIVRREKEEKKRR